MMNFRVWEEISKTMYYDMDSVLKNPSVIPSKLFSGEDELLKIMRSYGKLDKNGKEIFEGDIIELTNSDNVKVRVTCRFGEAKRILMFGSNAKNECEITGFYFEFGDFKTYPIVNNYMGKHDVEIFEVVGNIYENSKDKEWYTREQDLL